VFLLNISQLKKLNSRTIYTIQKTDYKVFNSIFIWHPTFELFSKKTFQSLGRFVTNRINKHIQVNSYKLQWLGLKWH